MLLQPMTAAKPVNAFQDNELLNGVIEKVMMSAMGVGILVLFWVAWAVHKGKIRPVTLLVSCGALLSLLLAGAGAAHDVACFYKRTMVEHRAYDFRYLSLFEAGNVFMFWGGVHAFVIRPMRRGQRWAFAIAAAVTGYALLYMIMLLPIFGMGNGIGLASLYFGALLFFWNDAGELPSEAPDKIRVRRLYFSLLVMVFTIEFGLVFLWPYPRAPRTNPRDAQFTFGPDEAAAALDFVVGKVLGIVMAILFALYARRKSRILRHDAPDLVLSRGQVARIAGAVVAFAFLLRLGIFRYLRWVGANDAIPPPHPQLFDVLVYAALGAAIVISFGARPAPGPRAIASAPTEDHGGT